MLPGVFPRLGPLYDESQTTHRNPCCLTCSGNQLFVMFQNGWAPAIWKGPKPIRFGAFSGVVANGIAHRPRRPAGMIVAMGIEITSAGVADYHQVLADHPRYWGDRDLRSLHLVALVHECASTCLVARADDGIRGYIFGFVTPEGTGYVHLIATRDDSRGTGLGRRLYAAFAEAAERHGASQLKAITSIQNAGSIAFHRSLGFDTTIVEDYNGPGRSMAVFHRGLPLNVS